MSPPRRPQIIVGGDQDLRQPHGFKLCADGSQFSYEPWEDPFMEDTFVKKLEIGLFAARASRWTGGGFITRAR